MGTRKYDQTDRRERWLARMTPALVTTIKACFAVEGKKSYLRVCAIFVAVSKELGRQPADCENCSQHLHTLIETLRASYDPMRGDPKTFTYKFARNRGRSFFRLRRERSHELEIKPTKADPTGAEIKGEVKPIVFPTAPSPDGEPVDPGCVDSSLLLSEQRDLLAKALACLEQTKRVLVVRVASCELTWEQLAAENETKPTTVQSRWMAAMEELKAIIENSGKRPPKPPRTRKPRPRKD